MSMKVWRQLNLLVVILTTLNMPRIQVVVRGARDDYPTARDGARTIRDLIGRL
jgi:hypothetical protein